MDDTDDSESSEIKLEKKRNVVAEEEEDWSDYSFIPHASISKAPRIFAKQYKATIFPKLYDIQLERETFYNALTNEYENIELIVSKEENQNLSSKRASYILKIFCDFTGTAIRGMKTPQFYVILNKTLRNEVGEEVFFSDLESKNMSDNEKRPEITIESVKCKKRAIFWATIDYESRFTANFDPSSEFSEPYRLFNWAKMNAGKKFSLEMPFVQSSRFSHNRLRAYLEEYKNKSHVKHTLKKCSIGPFFDWRDTVIKWWNDWIDQGWYHKRKQLFIVSRPNCGKTTFIRDVLFRADLNDQIPHEAILIPERAGCKTTISNFAFQRANSSVNVVLFCDEFDARVYNIELLKIVLQGDYFSAIKKYQASGDDMCLRIPMIFASNHMLPETEDTVGLAERFMVVKIPDDFKPFPSSEDSHKPYAEMLRNEGII